MITPESYELLSADEKAQFVMDDNGKYVPKSNGQGSEDGDDITGLKNKNKELFAKIKQMESENRDKETSNQNLQDQINQLTAKLNNGGEDDYKALYNDVSKKLEAEKGEKETLYKQMETKELNMTANKIAAGLTSDKYKQEMLAKEIMPRLTYKDGNAKILDADGNLTADSVDDLASEISNAERYSFLVDGGQGSGGNAPGSTTSAVVPKHKNDFNDDAEMFAYMEKFPSDFDALPDDAE
ncbi:MULTISPECIES: hypothetical protein [Gammaproteobacteria]|uniref:hypothetical protein n=1 Tax=Gammaproteobacteria TaxID=1236 RepID=UPI00235A4040|nr:hypothetical protein [Pseudoalteromonas sp. GABNS16G]MDC9602916.1 hypothetical protein [Pseudoalteromonas sp. GABNS16G]